MTASLARVDEVRADAIRKLACSSVTQTWPDRIDYLRVLGVSDDELRAALTERQLQWIRQYRPQLLPA